MSSLSRKSMWLPSIVFFWVLLVGMGQKPGLEVPLPDIDFKATIRDDQDIATKISHASWEGSIFFTGMRGKGVVTISFEKVKKVSATGSGSGTKSDFQITLKNGDMVAVSLDNDSKFLGTTNFGSFRISAKNIKEIVFD